MNIKKEILYVVSDPAKGIGGDFDTLAGAKAYAKKFNFSLVTAQLRETSCTNLYTHDIKKDK